MTKYIHFSLTALIPLSLMATPSILLLYVLSLNTKMFYNLALWLFLFVLLTILSILTYLIHVLLPLAIVWVLRQLGWQEYMVPPTILMLLFPLGTRENCSLEFSIFLELSCLNLSFLINYSCWCNQYVCVLYLSFLSLFSYCIYLD